MDCSLRVERVPLVLCDPEALARLRARRDAERATLTPAMREVADKIEARFQRAAIFGETA